jgi:phospholipid/cholesterol/gamma-HCH transport system ATP-binding protein
LPGSTPTAVVNRDASEATGADLRVALAEVVTGDSLEAERLAYARTTVAFRVAGEEHAVTLVLDEAPCAVADDRRADVDIELRPGAAASFLRGALPMAAAVITGDATATGPVRSYLQVDPILRGLLARRYGARPDDEHEPSIGARPIGPIDSNLLAIETRDLHKRFDSQYVLQGVDIRIPEGVIAIVLGPSGAGKSVLLQHIIGLLKPDSGDVLIRGRSLAAMDRAELLDLRTEIGVMFQDGALFSAMTVYDNVAFPLRQHTDFDDSEIEQLVMEHLDSVGLAAARDRMPNELSGGMRKRAGLARALALNPEIVLGDEPDSGLDPVRTALLGRLLIEQHARYGGTMVVVTHNVMLARLIGEHISVIWQGKVLESGLAAHVFDSDSPFVRQFIAGETKGPLGMDT